MIRFSHVNFSFCQMGLFSTTQKFTGSIINELHERLVGEVGNGTLQCVQDCWASFITEYRKKKQVDNKYWANNTVYGSLSEGAKRNSMKADFKKRQDAVKRWYEEDNIQENELNNSL